MRKNSVELHNSRLLEIFGVTKVPKFHQNPLPYERAQRANPLGDPVFPACCHWQNKARQGKKADARLCITLSRTCGCRRRGTNGKARIAHRCAFAPESHFPRFLESNSMQRTMMTPFRALSLSSSHGSKGSGNHVVSGACALASNVAPRT